MAREQLKSLTEPMYYILLSLTRENHGYGIMQMIDELTEGRVVVGAGTLYSLLGRFEKEKFIEQIAEENRRKIYRLTESGHGILNEEYERLNKMVCDGKKFMSYDGEIKNPPADGGSGLSMPTEEAVLESEAAAKREESGTFQGRNPDKQEGRESQDRKGLNFGGRGKGVLIPT